MGRPRKWGSDAERKAASRGTEAAAPEIETQSLAFDAERADSEPLTSAPANVSDDDTANSSSVVADATTALEHHSDEAHDRDLEIIEGRYRGFPVADVHVQHEAHRYLFAERDRGAFYVRSPRGTLGLVPFPGSTVVWPWEAGWAQDLARANRVEPEERRPTDLDWFLRHTKGGNDAVAVAEAPRR